MNMIATNCKKLIFICYYAILLIVINIYVSYVLSEVFIDFTKLKNVDFCLLGFFLFIDILISSIFGYILYFANRFMKFLFLFLFYMSICLGSFIQLEDNLYDAWSLKNLVFYAFNAYNLLILSLSVVLLSFIFTKSKLSRKNF